jgi:hypothetical protein
MKTISSGISRNSARKPSATVVNSQRTAGDSVRCRDACRDDCLARA